MANMPRIRLWVGSDGQLSQQRLQHALWIQSRGHAPASVSVRKAPAFKLARRDDETINDLIRGWKESTEWSKYQPGTQRIYSGSLRKLERQWDGVPLAVIDHPRMYGKIMQWREAHSDHKPGTDNDLNALNSLLNFGIAIGKLLNNVAAHIPDLAPKGDRSQIIWTDEEIDHLVREADERGKPHVGDVILLAAHSGMRPQDLITVRYDHVQQTRIIKRALKRVKGLQRLVIVRRTQALEAVLDRLATRYRKEGVRTLLVNVDGSPWKYSQIDYQLRTLRRACSITRPNLKSGKPTEKHLHDFRGTFATRLFETTDFLDAEIARLLGWKESTVRLIRHMYVDERTRIVALGAQLQRRAEQLDARP